MAVHTSGRAGSGFLCRAHTVDTGQMDQVDMLEQALLRLVWLEQKRLAQTLAAHGLTVSQYLVLASVWNRQEGCPMGELAGEMLQSSATMTGIVDRLVRMQLVQREIGATDRRVVVIDLTQRGRDLLVDVRRAKRDRLQQILDRLAEADRAALVRLIEEYLEVSSQYVIGQ